MKGIDDTVPETINSCGVRSSNDHTMTGLNAFMQLKDSFKGKYSLWTDPGQEPHISETQLAISSQLNNMLLQLEYSWEFEKKTQSSMLAFTYHPKKELVSAVWIDTWHMQNEFMHCKGLLTKNGVLMVNGKYGAGIGPDWGWKTLLEVEPEDPSSLHLTMYNITPAGEQHLAVQADYTKQKDLD